MAHILIVDDESGIRDSLRGILEDEGYKVSASPSGEDCLELLRKNSYDLILLDVWILESTVSRRWRESAKWKIRRKSL